MFSQDAEGRSLVLSQLTVPRIVDSHGRPYPVWMERKDEWMRVGDRREVRRGSGKRRGNCDQYVK